MFVPSSSNPLSGWAFAFFSQVTPSAGKGAKLLSKDKQYIKICSQFKKLLIVSTFERHQHFGACRVEAILCCVEQEFVLEQGQDTLMLCLVFRADFSLDEE